jgi:hypothetical protein
VGQQAGASNLPATAWAGAVSRLPGAGRREQICRRTNLPRERRGLQQARILEPLAMVWINQSLLRGKGRDWALAAVSMS